MLTLLLSLTLAAHAEDRTAPWRRPDVARVREDVKRCQDKWNRKDERKYTQCAIDAYPKYRKAMYAYLEERLSDVGTAVYARIKRGQIAWDFYMDRYLELPDDASLFRRQRAYSYRNQDTLNRMLWITNLGEPWSDVVDVSAGWDKLEACFSANARSADFAKVCEDEMMADLGGRFTTYFEEHLTKVSAFRADQLRRGQRLWEDYRKTFCQPASGGMGISFGEADEPANLTERSDRAGCWFKETVGRFEWVSDSTVVPD